MNEKSYKQRGIQQTSEENERRLLLETKIGDH
jgi:hypothetical protein